MVIKNSLRLKEVETRIADVCCTIMFRSVAYKCRDIFYPDVMPFGGIVGVFEKQEVHVVFSFAFRVAIFHPLLLSSKAKTLSDMEGLSFSKRGICFV